MASKPCQRCGVRAKEPGAGRRYCQECRTFVSMSIQERQVEAKRLYAEAVRGSNGRPKRRLAKDAPEGTKWCPRCSQYLLKVNFPKTKSRKDGLQPYCDTCYKSNAHSKRIAKVYGLTSDQYTELLNSQDGGCAICGTKPKRKNLAVDHDHETGFVRGLLCTMCNHKVLGGAKEDASILRRAADYLDTPPAFNVIGEVKPDD